jgi:hypothetical protein
MTTGGAVGGGLATAVAIALIVVILAVAGGSWWRRRDTFSLRNTRLLTSDVDGYAYKVHPAHGGYEAADALAQINARVVELLRSLRQRYIRDPRGKAYPQRVAATQRLLGLYNPDNLAENSPQDPTGDTSYTIDKGAIVALCLRTKDGKSTLHEMNTLMFVALHELTHVAVEVYDHPTEFWQAFRWIIAEAELAGIYEVQDFGKHNVIFCGTNIDYQPLYDSGLPDLI